jgi:hypothetical protein
MGSARSDFSITFSPSVAARSEKQRGVDAELSALTAHRGNSGVPRLARPGFTAELRHRLGDMEDPAHVRLR